MYWRNRKKDATIPKSIANFLEPGGDDCEPRAAR